MFSFCINVILCAEDMFFYEIIYSVYFFFVLPGTNVMSWEIYRKLLYFFRIFLESLNNFLSVQYTDINI